MITLSTLAGLGVSSATAAAGGAAAAAAGISAAGAATGTIFGAGVTAASVTAAGISATSLLSGALGTASALGSIGSGLAANSAAKTEAQYMGYQAKAAELEGRRQALGELEAFNRSQASAAAAMGPGNYLGSGMTTLRQNQENAEFNIGLTRLGAGVNADGIRAQAQQKRAEGRSAIMGGLLGAATSMGGTALKRKQQSIL